MFPCFRVLIILYMNPWKSQVAQATLIHVCMENILNPKKCSLPDTLHALQSCTAPIYPARPVWYRVQTGAACPASGRVVAWSALVLAPPWFWRVLCCCLCCAGRPGALGAGVSTGGVYRERRGWGKVSPVSSDQNKKGTFLPTPTPPSQNETYLIVQVSKNSKKYKKTPFGA